MSAVARTTNTQHHADHHDQQHVAPTNEINTLQNQHSSKAVRRSSKLTFGGGVYILVTLFLAVGAINSQNNLLFWLFGVAIATLIVSGVFSGNALMQVRLKAQAIPDAYAGDRLRLHYTVSNHSRFFPLLAAMISEVPEKLSEKKVSDAKFEAAALLHIGPQSRCKVTSSFVPSSRGRVAMREVRLTTRFPFGLLQKTLVFECPRKAMILPHILDIKPELIRVMQGHGEEVRKQTDSRGSSNEYWGLREYTPGDPKRAIAWKQSARQGKLVVVEHAQPISTRLWVWIAEPKGGFENLPINSERAIALGASLITQATTRGVPIGLWMPAYGIRMMPGNGKAHMMRCLRALGMIDFEQAAARSTGRSNPPPSASADDVLVIATGQPQIGHAKNLRVLYADDPASYLVDPASMPMSLQGTPTEVAL